LRLAKYSGAFSACDELSICLAGPKRDLLDDKELLAVIGGKEEPVVAHPPAENTFPFLAELSRSPEMGRRPFGQLRALRVSEWPSVGRADLL